MGIGFLCGMTLSSVSDNLISGVPVHMFLLNVVLLKRSFLLLHRLSLVV